MYSVRLANRSVKNPNIYPDQEKIFSSFSFSLMGPEAIIQVCGKTKMADTAQKAVTWTAEAGCLILFFSRHR